MATVQERQRTRRERLAEQGLTEVSLVVPRSQGDHLRAIAHLLRAGQPVSARLLPALQELREMRGELAQLGVARAGVFGSTARGEERSDSDLDVVLHLGDRRAIHPYRLMDLKDTVATRLQQALPDVTVDVVFYEALTPAVRAEVDREVVHAD